MPVYRDPDDTRGTGDRNPKGENLTLWNGSSARSLS